MSQRRRRKKRSARSAPPPRPAPGPFLRRRSTRWLFPAVITMAVAVALGTIADRCGGASPAGHATPTTTVAAGAAYGSD